MPERAAPAIRLTLSAPELLRLARTDREAARTKLQELDVATQAALCQALRPEVRSEFLMLLDDPEKVVPHLPEAEICLTIRASGMSEAAWLLEIATPDQLRACFDLDCWQTYELDRERVRDWIEALIEAGRPALVRAVRETDLELWVLALWSMADVMVLGKEESPPEGWFTLDGVAYFGVHEGVEFAHAHELLGALFEYAQGYYWMLVYGVLFESPADCEEWALRWRAGRLNDLGFPDREQAMQAYRPLRTKDLRDWEWVEPDGALVPSMELPERLRGTLLGQALLELPAPRAADLMGYILAVVNTLAVADELPLSDAETIPRSLDKAVRGIEAGLREAVRVQGRPPGEVLDATRPLDLFRIGATLNRALRER